MPRRPAVDPSRRRMQRVEKARRRGVLELVRRRRRDGHRERGGQPGHRPGLRTQERLPNSALAQRSFAWITWITHGLRRSQPRGAWLRRSLRAVVLSQPRCAPLHLVQMRLPVLRCQLERCSGGGEQPGEEPLRRPARRLHHFHDCALVQQPGSRGGRGAAACGAPVVPTDCAEHRHAARSVLRVVRGKAAGRRTRRRQDVGGSARISTRRADRALGRILQWEWHWSAGQPNGTGLPRHADAAA